MMFNFLVLQRKKEFTIVDFRKVLNTYRVEYREYKKSAVVHSNREFDNYEEAKACFDFNRKIFETLGYSLVRDAYTE